MCNSKYTLRLFHFQIKQTNQDGAEVAQAVGPAAASRKRDQHGDDDLPALFYPGDSYGAPSSPAVTSRSVLLDTRVLHSYRDSYLK